MQTSGVKFGTSGARGLVSSMTDRVCAAYTVAFLQHLEKCECSHKGDRVAIAGDLRASTKRIMQAVSSAVSARGYIPVSCGRIPSPAVALYGLQEAIPAIMVTGSHIPDDRNGIKFNGPKGEILKEDEASMCNQVVELSAKYDSNGSLVDPPAEVGEQNAARNAYKSRFFNAFPKDLLTGKRLGLYAHSAVGRDIMQEIYEGLGARVTRLADSETFIPVDTEAIRPEDVALAAQWSREHAFDAIVSTDGDGDRPLLADEQGKWMRGDVVGIVCARQLGADVVVTPVSCNTAVEACGAFSRVVRTRIGSPYVVAAMQKAVRDGAERVMGYEANGGFLTASSISTPFGKLSPLPTRDAALVHLAVLWASVSTGRRVSQLLGDLPPRFTWSDRIKSFPTEVSQGRLNELRDGGTSAIEAAFGQFGLLDKVDFTDGMRMTFSNGSIVHIRASGNA
ncbi:MAG: phosphomannomutase, partial [Sorangium cellulosum]